MPAITSPCPLYPLPPPNFFPTFPPPPFSLQVLTDRVKDETDLVARCLPLLKGANPLAAWAQLLGREEAQEHARWGADGSEREREARGMVRRGFTAHPPTAALPLQQHLKHSPSFLFHPAALDPLCTAPLPPDRTPPLVPCQVG